VPRPTDAQRKAFAALARSYRAELPAKLQAIADEATSLGAGGWDAERVKSFYRLLHCLAGSAAIYGFDAVSREAAELEQMVTAALERRSAEELAEQLPPRVQALVRTSLTIGMGRPVRRTRGH
jgi:HPt (histidine-containing phosphotransfer) domain-containing protein